MVPRNNRPDSLSQDFFTYFLYIESRDKMIQKPKGTADLLPEEIKIWHYIEETARIILGDYQFEEMRTPMFESYELFSRGVGDTSDIV